MCSLVGGYQSDDEVGPLIISFSKALDNVLLLLILNGCINYNDVLVDTDLDI
jgi:hypothetical protein